MKKIKKIFKSLKEKIINHKLLFALICFLLIVSGIAAYFITYGEFVSKFNGYGNNNTSITSTTVIIDDLKSDYDYYMGLNYTTPTTTGQVPTTENKNIYSNNNLVQAKVIYDGRDINNSSIIGHVSRSEQQYLYNYYKIYPVNNNGTASNKNDDYIEIELMDAPFSQRPNNKTFNGWISNMQGVEISLDKSIYTRYAKVPITYNGNEPNALTVTFNASWVAGKTTTVSSSRSWSTAFGDLDSAGLHQLTTTHSVYTDPSVDGYYLRDTITSSVRVTRSGTGTNRRWTESNLVYGTCTDCYTSDHVHHDTYQCPKPTYTNFTGSPNPRDFTNDCTIYYLQDSNDTWDENATYYQYRNGSYSTVTLSQIYAGEETLPEYNNANMAGYYKRVTIARYASYAGYYNSSGVLQTSGTCNTSGGCTYYEYEQYYNSSNQQNIIDPNSTYYYLATRDTNVIQMTSDMTNTWGSSQSKPFTLTADLGYGTNYQNSIRWRVRSNNNGFVVHAYNDTAIENIRIDYNAGVTGHDSPATNTTTNGYIFGDYHNLKLGRGIIRYNTNGNFLNVTGGNRSATGSSSSPTRYKLMIQSGFYSTVGVTGSSISNNSTQPNMYVDAIAEYGNDYDRAKSDNAKLDVSYCASGSWGGSIRSNNSNNVAINTTLKSGTFGSNKYDLTTGIYVGGRYGGNHNAVRTFTMEGGYVYNLIGGPLSATNRANVNDVIMYVKGGSIDMITGGAGTSATYGNRIIQVTGGTINYSVFGGSNGEDGEDGDGTLNGSPYVYVGGSATIGNSTYVTNNSTLWGAEAGSVFGIGNGNSSYATIGSANNSYVVIDTNALVRRNVYAGGNYSAVGVSSSASTTESKIKINGGTINGNVYGGGNRNGSGDSSTVATVNIDMLGGTVDNAIYGGPNEKGTIYGSVNINMIGGETDYVYGGGRGGYSSNSNPGTYVSRNVNVTIGDSNSTLSPTVNEAVYGGSAFGTVNGTTRNNTRENYETNVTVNKGTVDQVFGGGQGNSTYTPYVKGDVTVTVNGGDIDDVFGGNDAAGSPNGTVDVYLKGGTVDNAYGGGNKTGVTTTNVYLQGSTCGKVFGGSNQSGNVTTANVSATSGSADYIYGGNNAGGTVTTTYVTLNGASVNTELFGGGDKAQTTTTNVTFTSGTANTIYGGGNEAATATTNVTLNGGTTDYVYGGGKSANVTTKSNVTLAGTTVNHDIYGGSNTSGTVAESAVNINSGRSKNVFGGNNVAGSTTLARVNLNGGNVTSAYAGGNQAPTGTAYITLDGSSVSNVFGGGYSAGITTSNVTLKSGNATNVYGGSNQSGNVTTSNITTATTTKTVPVTSNDLVMTVTSSSTSIPSGGDTSYNSLVTLNVTITNNSSSTITEWAGTITDINSELYENNSNHDITESNGTYTFNQNNNSDANSPFTLASGASHTFSFIIYSKDSISNFSTEEEIITGEDASGTSFVQNGNVLVVSNLYGGNNQGGVVTTTNVTLNTGYYHNVYGGGNQAAVGSTNVGLAGVNVGGALYGGGNAAAVQGNTKLKLSGCTVLGSVFGGGNAGTVAQNSYVYILDSTIGKSAFAGGNGTAAIVQGNTNIVVDGTSSIGNHVFGGGNAAATGTDVVDNSNCNVVIAGGTIGGNVYGGANTAKVYGYTNMYIGYTPSNAYLNDHSSDTFLNSLTLHRGDIDISGTVFGGGEANESGSEEYDFSFISVTKDILIKIDGGTHTNYNIDGSIFGSGNASSSAGNSYIYIDNYGTVNHVKHNVSIQRASEVDISNSYIVLAGAADRTNEYNTELYSLSRVNYLKLKNDSTLYLKTNANLLKHFKSCVDIDGDEVLASVEIDENTGEVTKNVDNRLYILAGKTLNILTTESISSNGYGDVDGMTFFGMYAYDRDGEPYTAMYQAGYDNGDSVPSTDLYYFDDGSSVLGKHKTNHDITVDGFYSNYVSEDNDGTIEVQYVGVTPEDANYYMWTIGSAVDSYEMTLTASKYLTLGNDSLQLIRHSNPNTTFTVLGFNSSELEEGINLLDEAEIPRIATNSDDADNNMSLVMKTPSSGWMTNGSTTFLSDVNDPIDGTIDYKTANVSAAPTLQFYLYHSKNLGSSGDMGTVTISLMAITRIDDLNVHAERVNIVLTLKRALYNTIDYEAAIATGKHYDLFGTEQVNISTDSSLSAYYSLYVDTDADKFYKTGYHRSFVSDYVFPENTKITMIDYYDRNNPEYYYYVINSTDYANYVTEYNTNHEVAYDLSKFIKMGSTSSTNNYSDPTANSRYYNSSTGVINEEFVFIVDFNGTEIDEDVLNKSLLIELRDDDNQTKASVLGTEQALMFYSLYDDKNAIINVDGELDTNNIHPGEKIGLTVTTDYEEQTSGNVIVTDTSFYDKQLGIKITLFDENGTQVTGPSLLGVSYSLDGVDYYPRNDGTLRLNISERVTNVASRIRFNTSSSLAPGNYTMKIESFGSADGIYYGAESSAYCEIEFAVLDTVYGLSVSLPEKQVIVDAKSGTTLNKNNNVIINYKYNSVLTNPNIHISLQRRKYNEIYSREYDIVDFKDYFTNSYIATSVDKEYLLTNTPSADVDIFLYLKDNLMTGTYKIVLSLYDGNSKIGDVSQYIIIK